MKDIGHHGFKFPHIQAKCALAVSRIAHTAHDAQRQSRLRAINALSDSSFGLAVLPCQLDDSETFRNVKGFAHGRVPGDRMVIVRWPLAPKQIDAHRVIKKHPAWFHRCGAVWTPTVLLLDAAGKERVRLEGYLPNDDFVAALMSGLGRIAFVQKKYSDAERWYGDVVARFANSHFAPEAMYWRAVAHYKATNDHTVLGKVAEELRSKSPSSIWASKAIPWLH